MLSLDRCDDFIVALTQGNRLKRMVSRYACLCKGLWKRTGYFHINYCQPCDMYVYIYVYIYIYIYIVRSSVCRLSKDKSYKPTAINIIKFRQNNTNGKLTNPNPESWSAGILFRRKYWWTREIISLCVKRVLHFANRCKLRFVVVLFLVKYWFH